MQGEAALLIFTEAEEVAKLRKEVEERNRQLQTLVNGLTAENLELKARISKVERILADLERKLSDYIRDLQEDTNNNCVYVGDETKQP